jgi:hypothetical protein
MNQLELINRFWEKDSEYHFSDRETALYFYLVNVCNTGKGRNPFGLPNNMTRAKFGWGKTSFDRTRGRLREAGLIDFHQGLGRGNISKYIIKDVNSAPNDTCINISLFDNEKGQEKGNQTNTFSEQLPEKESEKATQTDNISGQFSEKETKKDAQADAFSERFFTPKAAETEDLQEMTSKNEIQHIDNNNINIYNNNIYNTDNKYNNNDMLNLKKEKEKEKSFSQKEKEVFDLFRTVCRSFPKIVQLTRNRKEKILRRLGEMGGMKILEQVFRKMEASEFLKGNNRYGWSATFDWVFKNSDNWVKIIEGNYDNRIAQPQFVKPANDARFMGMLQTDLSKF